MKFKLHLYKQQSERALTAQDLDKVSGRARDPFDLVARDEERRRERNAIRAREMVRYWSPDQVVGWRATA